VDRLARAERPPDPKDGVALTTMGLDVRREDRILTVALTGDWKLDRAIPRFAPLLESDPQAPAAQVVDFDASDLGSWDSSLLTFLQQGMIHCEAHDLEFRSGNLPEGISRLLDLARAVPEKETAQAPKAPSLASAMGRWGLGAWDGLLAAISFLGEVTDSFRRLILRRFRMRWRDFWVVVQSNSSGALPIVTLIAFLVGMIISFLGAVVLRRFGAGYFVSYLVGYGMLREMAALMTGIIMAGRTGAAFAAELGSMKISEEIDAYRTLGISPVDHLVMPRVLGLLVTMPLLSIYAGFIGILGGMVVALTVLDLSVTQFMGGLMQAVTLSDGLLGVFKGTVFGLIIGLSGCMKGMQTGGDAAAVGKAATSAVVLGITLIIGANAVIDWLAVLLNI
jgi:phospholipid/cholesterol/gamma-HCH transport system permease protein